MPLPSQFSSLLQELGISENTALQLSQKGINDLDKLVTTTKQEAADIVHDPILGTILPVLNDQSFSIFTASDKYAKTREILAHYKCIPTGKGHVSSDGKGHVKSDAGSFVQSGPGVETSSNTTRNGWTTTQVNGVNGGSVNITMSRTTHTNNTRMPNPPRLINFANLVDNSMGASQNITFNSAAMNAATVGPPPKPVHHSGPSNSIQITGGSFVNSSILSNNVTYNVNNAQIHLHQDDSPEAKDARRKKKLNSTFVIDGKEFNTSSLHFSENPNFWLEDLAVQPTTEDIYEDHIGDDTVYPVNNWGKSRALFINNVQFPDAKASRSGAHYDTANLSKVLTQLGFEVQTEENKKGCEIRQLLREFTSSRKNAAAPMSLVFIGSHGGRKNNRDFFLGVDGDEVYEDDVQSFFMESKCKTLRKKPKIFLFQFCRSETGKDKKASADAVPIYDEEESMDTSPSVEGDASASYEEKVYPAQDKRDMLVSHATSAGTKAYRDTAEGTWYVTALCKILKEKSHSEDLLSMLTQVNNTVTRKLAYEGNKEAVQLCQIDSTLTKKVKFFPLEKTENPQ